MEQTDEAANTCQLSGASRRRSLHTIRTLPGCTFTPRLFVFRLLWLSSERSRLGMKSHYLSQTSLNTWHFQFAMCVSDPDGQFTSSRAALAAFLSGGKSLYIERDDQQELGSGPCLSCSNCPRARRNNQEHALCCTGFGADPKLKMILIVAANSVGTRASAKQARKIVYKHPL